MTLKPIKNIKYRYLLVISDASTSKKVISQLEIIHSMKSPFKYLYKANNMTCADLMLRGYFLLY